MRLLVFLAAALVLATACGSVPTSPTRVVLVTLDTLRADRLGAYGSDAGLTPNLDRMARSGVLFENASTVAPLTLPAHASILTGVTPLRHGIRDNGGYHLGPEHVTVAEVLRGRGYRTGAFVGAFVLDSRWGVDQGFERYHDEFDFGSFEDASLGSVQRPGGEVLEEALLWMEEVKDEPFFAWLHFYDPHAPYEPPQDFRRDRASGRWAGYDGEVAYVDALVGKLLSWLEKKGLLEETLVAVIADHGEALEDHGELDHGFFVYDATMKVPFLLRGPGLAREGARVNAQVRVTDLMPTVLDLLGAPIPEAAQGVSLKGLLNGEKEDLSLRAYGESHTPRLHYGWSELRSLRTESFHFIAAPRPELYDLRADPRETRNLAPERPEAAAELLLELEELVAELSEGASKPEPSAELDDETREKLRVLGYLGGPSRSPAASTPSSSLADPKDKIELHVRVKSAEAALGDGRLDEALQDIERVLSTDSEVVEAHRIHGDLLKAMREPERAALAYRRALSLEPEHKVASFHLALLHLELGRVDAAEAGLRRVLELDPRDNKSYFLLAKLLVARREFRSALSLLDEAIRNTSDAAPFHTARAECFLALGELDEAETAVRTALRLKPDAPRVHHFEGVVREARGDVEGAITSYERELARFRVDPETFLRLADLYRKKGSSSEELRVLEAAVEAAPRDASVHVRLGRAFLEAGQIERGRMHLSQALRLGGDPETAALARGLLAQLQ